MSAQEAMDKFMTALDAVEDDQTRDTFMALYELIYEGLAVVAGVDTEKI